MPNFISVNTASSTGIATSSTNGISAVSEILTDLGFEDQKAEVIAEDQLHHNNYFQLHKAIENYQTKSDRKNQVKLTKILNKEIKRLRAEYKYIKAKQIAYQQAAEQQNAQQAASSSYLTQWGNWFLNSAKQFFGSDNEYQAERYRGLAEVRQEQIAKLKNKANLNKRQAEDVVELNADDFSPMGRNLLALPEEQPEFQVNTYTMSSQKYPAIGVQPSGDFVIAWQSSGQDGDSDGIYAQRFSAVGAPLGKEFRVNTDTLGVQERPAIGVQPSGDFVITWGSSLNSWDVRAQRFSATGFLLGAEFQVNNNTVGVQLDPAIAVQPTGDFIITWACGYNSPRNLSAQRFDATGSLLGAEFAVGSNPLYAETQGAIGVQPNGDFVITWGGANGGGLSSGYGVHVQRYNATGLPLGSDFRGDSVDLHNNYYKPTIGIQPSGNFVIAWTSQGQDGVYARGFSLNGSPLGSEFRVNTYAELHQGGSAIGVQPNGDFLIIWTDGNNADILARRLSASGSQLGAEFFVNTYKINVQSNAVIGVQPSGDFIITWDSFGQDGDQEGIFAKIFPSVSTSNSESNPESNSQSNSLSLTEKIGIGAGMGAAALLAVAGIFCYRKKSFADDKESQDSVKRLHAQAKQAEADAYIKKLQEAEQKSNAINQKNTNTVSADIFKADKLKQEISMLKQEQRVSASKSGSTDEKSVQQLPPQHESDPEVSVSSAVPTHASHQRGGGVELASVVVSTEVPTNLSHQRDVELSAEPGNRCSFNKLM